MRYAQTEFEDGERRIKWRRTEEYRERGDRNKINERRVFGLHAKVVSKQNKKSSCCKPTNAVRKVMGGRVYQDGSNEQWKPMAGNAMLKNWEL